MLPSPLFERERFGMRTAIYTSITAGYDELREPAHVTPGVDYVCFSDQPLESRLWQVRPLAHVAETPSRSARYHKLMSHRVLPDHDVTLWLDASYRIDRELGTLIESWLDGWDFAVRRHPTRMPLCVYAEARACVRLRRGDPAAIEAQVAAYRELGYPARNGVYVTGILARRHTADVAAFNEAWWNELSRFSDRDQLSFPVVAWRQKLRFNVVKPKEHNHHQAPELRWMKHRV
jgi:hypothetical protein